ncbi:MAG TPA: DUF4124 domain-containing protein [Usitatibacter sp.]|nr:DUF4124 domain-containing protein [Usitatibacter sp.]
MPRPLRAACIACALALGLAAHAQVLYKWTDAQGRVQYSDQPPKNFKGEVTRIEPDVPADKPAAPPKAPPRADAPKPGDGTLIETAARRRALRESLQENIDRARARVEAARKALDASKEPGEDDRQIIQHRSAKGGMLGMAPRSNCRDEKGADGKVVRICPASIVRPEYLERVAGLEEELRKAEAALESAQADYRRNVD